MNIVFLNGVFNLLDRRNEVDVYAGAGRATYSLIPIYTAEENPRGPDDGETKVVRGGAWKFSADSCRSGYRYNEAPGYSDVCFGYDIYGFRCVRNAPDTVETETAAR